MRASVIKPGSESTRSAGEAQLGCLQHDTTFVLLSLSPLAPPTTNTFFSSPPYLPCSLLSITPVSSSPPLYPRRLTGTASVYHHIHRREGEPQYVTRRCSLQLLFVPPTSHPPPSKQPIMATPSHHTGNNASPDTLITIKISVNDSLKKLKLPLKDLGANVLIDKLRHCLNIKPEQQAVFERFSDSAGGFIVLEPTNSQVFKTLIRAAKAKSKLRLKATVTPDLTEKKAEEDAPAQQDITPTMLAQKASEPVIVRSPVNQATPRDSTALDGRSIGSGIFQFREARASQQTLVPDEAPVPQAFTADRSDFFAGVPAPSGLAQRELAFRTREPAVAPAAPAQGQWSVYCNSCDAAMFDAHFHCSICDGGDYDLCEACISNGTLCPGEGHWLIKRSIKEGKVVTSTTERIGRKHKEAEKEVSAAFAEDVKTLAEEPRTPTRTCNNCVYVLPEHEFVTCTTCEDFDLCIPCHTASKHGHHPAHGFKPATENTILSLSAEAALAPGRHVRHNAICDGCDKTIYGIRHKCLNCPDWDYCSECVKQAPHKHARHRFTAIYSPIAEPQPVFTRHTGIYCDGPLCNKNGVSNGFITGVRYKCAVCNDTDFCASCEALPGNHHNRTHPLIKFKTPMPFIPLSGANTASKVQTVAEIKPEIKEEKTMPIEIVKPETPIKQESVQTTPVPASLLGASFVRDSVPDGMVVAPGARFTQIWTLKNDGAFPWPAGCSVRYVGGDNMLNVDNGHPSSVAAIADATESNVVGREVQVGEEIAFKLVLKAPLREGKAISYWRVKAADGTPFGHRLWCDVEVKQPQMVQPSVVPPGKAYPDCFKDYTAQPFSPQGAYANPANALDMLTPTQKETAKLRVEAIKAKILKARAEKHNRAVAEAKAIAHAKIAKAAADKKSAEENAKVKKIIEAVTQAPAEETEDIATSQMVFPKLEKESPEASIIQSSSSSKKGKAAYVEDEDVEETTTVPMYAAPSVSSPPTVAAGEDFEDFTDLEVLSADDMESEDDGFLTDEEYDILDASDQETVASK
ncbi:hypothetical protein Q7P37_000089 [Cladosporium fusiforme]